jgi:probable rRNA maturation factor
MEESLEQSDQPPPSVSIQGDADVRYDWLIEHTIAALTFLSKEESEITIRVVDDATMSELHRKHSGVNGTTDVLTFDNGSNEHSVCADIACCVDEANREAGQRGHSLDEELLLYIMHGILHCCGFDDGDENSHREMHNEEDRVLEAIGVGSVWSKDS